MRENKNHSKRLGGEMKTPLEGGEESTSGKLGYARNKAGKESKENGGKYNGLDLI